MTYSRITSENRPKGLRVEPGRSVIKMTQVQVGSIRGVKSLKILNILGK